MFLNKQGLLMNLILYRYKTTEIRLQMQLFTANRINPISNSAGSLQGYLD